MPINACRCLILLLNKCDVSEEKYEGVYAVEGNNAPILKLYLVKISGIGIDVISY